MNSHSQPPRLLKTVRRTARTARKSPNLDAGGPGALRGSPKSRNLWVLSLKRASLRPIHRLHLQTLVARMSGGGELCLAGQLIY